MSDMTLVIVEKIETELKGNSTIMDALVNGANSVYKSFFGYSELEAADPFINIYHNESNGVYDNNARFLLDVEVGVQYVVGIKEYENGKEYMTIAGLIFEELISTELKNFVDGNDKIHQSPELRRVTVVDDDNGLVVEEFFIKFQYYKDRR